MSIDTIKSEVIESLPCSVIQGSKLSSLLYTFYINKVTVLQRLINKVLYTKSTGDTNDYNSGSIDHNIVQYVDDTNNIVSSQDSGNIYPFIDMYLKLIENIYEINKLKFNQEQNYDSI